MVRREIILTRGADFDSDEAYRWYEARDKGVGGYFDTQLMDLLARIADQPFSFPASHGVFRKGLVKRFPFAVYFQVFEQEIVIVAIVHGARDPRHIEKLIHRKL